MYMYIYVYVYIYICMYIYIIKLDIFKTIKSFYKSISPMDDCFLLLGVPITSLFILFLVCSSSLGGVVLLLKLNEMLWS